MIITYISLKSYKSTIDKISKIFIISWVLTWSRNGFYLENLWIDTWNVVKKSFFEFRKVHTGNLNYNLAEATIVAIGVLAYMIGG